MLKELSTSGIKFEFISALKATLSVSAFPNVRLPPIIASPVTFK